MAKTNEYRERKKLQDGSKYLEKERKRQKKHYVKVKRHRQSLKQSLDTSNTTIANSSPISLPSTDSPLLVAMKFPKRGESSRKRKRRSDDRLYKKIAKLEEEKRSLQKRNATLRKRVQRSRKEKQSTKMNAEVTPRKSVSKLLRQSGLSPSTTLAAIAVCRH